MQKRPLKKNSYSTIKMKSLVLLILPILASNAIINYQADMTTFPSGVPLEYYNGNWQAACAATGEGDDSYFASMMCKRLGYPDGIYDGEVDLQQDAFSDRFGTIQVKDSTPIQCRDTSSFMYSTHHGCPKVSQASSCVSGGIISKAKRVKCLGCKRYNHTTEILPGDQLDRAVLPFNARQFHFSALFNWKALGSQAVGFGPGSAIWTHSTDTFEQILLSIGDSVQVTFSHNHVTQDNLLKIHGPRTAWGFRGTALYKLAGDLGENVIEVFTCRLKNGELVKTNSGWKRDSVISETGPSMKNIQYKDIQGDTTDFWNSEFTASSVLGKYAHRSEGMRSMTLKDKHWPSWETHTSEVTACDGQSLLPDDDTYVNTERIHFKVSPGTGMQLLKTYRHYDYTNLNYATMRTQKVTPDTVTRAVVSSVEFRTSDIPIPRTEFNEIRVSLDVNSPHTVNGIQLWEPQSNDDFVDSLVHLNSGGSLSVTSNVGEPESVDASTVLLSTADDITNSVSVHDGQDVTLAKLSSAGYSPHRPCDTQGNVINICMANPSELNACSYADSTGGVTMLIRNAINACATSSMCTHIQIADSSNINGDGVLNTANDAARVVFYQDQRTGVRQLRAAISYQMYANKWSSFRNPCAIGSVEGYMLGGQLMNPKWEVTGAFQPLCAGVSTEATEPAYPSGLQGDRWWSTASHRSVNYDYTVYDAQQKCNDEPRCAGFVTHWAGSQYLAHWAVEFKIYADDYLNNGPIPVGQAAYGLSARLNSYGNNFYHKRAVVCNEYDKFDVDPTEAYYLMRRTDGNTWNYNNLHSMVIFQQGDQSNMLDALGGGGSTPSGYVGLYRDGVLLYNFTLQSGLVNSLKLGSYSNPSVTGTYAQFGGDSTAVTIPGSEFINRPPVAGETISSSTENIGVNFNTGSSTGTKGVAYGVPRARCAYSQAYPMLSVSDFQSSCDVVEERLGYTAALVGVASRNLEMPQDMNREGQFALSMGLHLGNVPTGVTNPSPGLQIASVAVDSLYSNIRLGMQVSQDTVLYTDTVKARRQSQYSNTLQIFCDSTYDSSAMKDLNFLYPTKGLGRSCVMNAGINGDEDSLINFGTHLNSQLPYELEALNIDISNPLMTTHYRLRRFGCRQCLAQETLDLENYQCQSCPGFLYAGSVGECPGPSLPLVFPTLSSGDSPTSPLLSFTCDAATSTLCPHGYGTCQTSEDCYGNGQCSSSLVSNGVVSSIPGIVITDLTEEEKQQVCYTDMDFSTITVTGGEVASRINDLGTPENHEIELLSHPAGMVMEYVLGDQPPGGSSSQQQVRGRWKAVCGHLSEEGADMVCRNMGYVGGTVQKTSSQLVKVNVDYTDLNLNTIFGVDSETRVCSKGSANLFDEEVGCDSVIAEMSCESPSGYENLAAVSCYGCRRKDHNSNSHLPDSRKFFFRAMINWDAMRTKSYSNAVDYDELGVKGILGFPYSSPQYSQGMENTLWERYDNLFGVGHTLLGRVGTFKKNFELVGPMGFGPVQYGASSSPTLKYQRPLLDFGFSTTRSFHGKFNKIKITLPQRDGATVALVQLWGKSGDSPQNLLTKERGTTVDISDHILDHRLNIGTRVETGYAEGSYRELLDGNSKPGYCLTSTSTFDDSLCADAARRRKFSDICGTSTGYVSVNRTKVVSDRLPSSAGDSHEAAKQLCDLHPQCTGFTWKAEFHSTTDTTYYVDKSSLVGESGELLSQANQWWYTTYGVEIPVTTTDPDSSFPKSFTVTDHFDKYKIRTGMNFWVVAGQPLSSSPTVARFRCYAKTPPSQFTITKSPSKLEKWNIDELDSLVIYSGADVSLEGTTVSLSMNDEAPIHTFTVAEDKVITKIKLPMSTTYTNMPISMDFVPTLRVTDASRNRMVWKSSDVLAVQTQDFAYTAWPPTDNLSYERGEGTYETVEVLKRNNKFKYIEVECTGPTCRLQTLFVWGTQPTGIDNYVEFEDSFRDGFQAGSTSYTLVENGGYYRKQYIFNNGVTSRNLNNVDRMIARGSKLKFSRLDGADMDYDTLHSISMLFSRRSVGQDVTVRLLKSDLSVVRTYHTMDSEASFLRLLKLGNYMEVGGAMRNNIVENDLQQFYLTDELYKDKYVWSNSDSLVSRPPAERKHPADTDSPETIILRKEMRHQAATFSPPVESYTISKFSRLVTEMFICDANDNVVKSPWNLAEGEAQSGTSEEGTGYLSYTSQTSSSLKFWELPVTGNRLNKLLEENPEYLLPAVSGYSGEKCANMEGIIKTPYENLDGEKFYARVYAFTKSIGRIYFQPTSVSTVVSTDVQEFPRVNMIKGEGFETETDGSLKNTLPIVTSVEYRVADQGEMQVDDENLESTKKTFLLRAIEADSGQLKQGVDWTEEYASLQAYQQWKSGLRQQISDSSIPPLSNSFGIYRSNCVYDQTWGVLTAPKTLASSCQTIYNGEQSSDCVFKGTCSRNDVNLPSDLNRESKFIMAFGRAKTSISSSMDFAGLSIDSVVESSGVKQQLGFSVERVGIGEKKWSPVVYVASSPGDERQSTAVYCHGSDSFSDSYADQYQGDRSCVMRAFNPNGISTEAVPGGEVDNVNFGTKVTQGTRDKFPDGSRYWTGVTSEANTLSYYVLRSFGCEQCTSDTLFSETSGLCKGCDSGKGIQGLGLIDNGQSQCEPLNMATCFPQHIDAHCLSNNCVKLCADADCNGFTYMMSLQEPGKAIIRRVAPERWSILYGDNINTRNSNNAQYECQCIHGFCEGLVGSWNCGSFDYTDGAIVISKSYNNNWKDDCQGNCAVVSCLTSPVPMYPSITSSSQCNHGSQKSPYEGFVDRLEATAQFGQKYSFYDFSKSNRVGPDGYYMDHELRTDYTALVDDDKEAVKGVGQLFFDTSPQTCTSTINGGCGGIMSDNFANFTRLRNNELYQPGIFKTARKSGKDFDKIKFTFPAVTGEITITELQIWVENADSTFTNLVGEESHDYIFSEDLGGKTEGDVMYQSNTDGSDLHPPSRMLDSNFTSHYVRKDGAISLTVTKSVRFWDSRDIHSIVVVGKPSNYANLQGTTAELIGDGSVKQVFTMDQQSPVHVLKLQDFRDVDDRSGEFLDNRFSSSVGEWADYFYKSQSNDCQSFNDLCAVEPHRSSGICSVAPDGTSSPPVAGNYLGFDVTEEEAQQRCSSVEECVGYTYRIKSGTSTARFKMGSVDYVFGSSSVYYCVLNYINRPPREGRKVDLITDLSGNFESKDIAFYDDSSTSFNEIVIHHSTAGDKEVALLQMWQDDSSGTLVNVIGGATVDIQNGKGSVDMMDGDILTSYVGGDIHIKKKTGYWNYDNIHSVVVLGAQNNSASPLTSPSADYRCPGLMTEEDCGEVATLAGSVRVSAACGGGVDNCPGGCYFYPSNGKYYWNDVKSGPCTTGRQCVCPPSWKLLGGSEVQLKVDGALLSAHPLTTTTTGGSVNVVRLGDFGEIYNEGADVYLDTTQIDTSDQKFKVRPPSSTERIVMPRNEGKDTRYPLFTGTKQNQGRGMVWPLQDNSKTKDSDKLNDNDFSEGPAGSTLQLVFRIAHSSSDDTEWNPELKVAVGYGTLTRDHAVTMYFDSHRNVLSFGGAQKRGVARIRTPQYEIQLADHDIHLRDGKWHSIILTHARKPLLMRTPRLYVDSKLVKGETDYWPEFNTNGAEVTGYGGLKRLQRKRHVADPYRVARIAMPSTLDVELGKSAVDFRSIIFMNTFTQSQVIGDCPLPSSVVAKYPQPGSEGLRGAPLVKTSAGAIVNDLYFKESPGFRKTCCQNKVFPTSKQEPFDIPSDRTQRYVTSATDTVFQIPGEVSQKTFTQGKFSVALSVGRTDRFKERQDSTQKLLVLRGEHSSISVEDVYGNGCRNGKNFAEVSSTGDCSAYPDATFYVTLSEEDSRNDNICADKCNNYIETHNSYFYGKGGPIRTSLVDDQNFAVKRELRYSGDQLKKDSYMICKCCETSSVTTSGGDYKVFLNTPCSPNRKYSVLKFSSHGKVYTSKFSNTLDRIAKSSEWLDVIVTFTPLQLADGVSKNLVTLYINGENVASVEASVSSSSFSETGVVELELEKNSMYSDLTIFNKDDISEIIKEIPYSIVTPPTKSFTQDITLSVPVTLRLKNIVKTALAKSLNIYDDVTKSMLPGSSISLSTPARRSGTALEATVTVGDDDYVGALQESFLLTTSSLADAISTEDTAISDSLGDITQIVITAPSSTSISEVQLWENNNGSYTNVAASAAADGNGGAIDGDLGTVVQLSSSAMTLSFPSPHAVNDMHSIVVVGNGAPAGGNFDFNKIELELPPPGTGKGWGVGISMFQLWKKNSDGSYDDLLRRAPNYFRTSGVCEDSTILTEAECQAHAERHGLTMQASTCSADHSSGCPGGCYFAKGYNKYYWNDGSQRSGVCSDSRACLCRGKNSDVTTSKSFSQHKPAVVQISGTCTNAMTSDQCRNEASHNYRYGPMATTVSAVTGQGCVLYTAAGSNFLRYYYKYEDDGGVCTATRSCVCSGGNQDSIEYFPEQMFNGELHGGLKNRHSDSGTVTISSATSWSMEDLHSIVMIGAGDDRRSGEEEFSPDNLRGAVVRLYKDSTEMASFKVSDTAPAVVVPLGGYEAVTAQPGDVYLSDDASTNSESWWNTEVQHVLTSYVATDGFSHGLSASETMYLSEAECQRYSTTKGTSFSVVSLSGSSDVPGCHDTSGGTVYNYNTAVKSAATSQLSRCSATDTCILKTKGVYETVTTGFLSTVDPDHSKNLLNAADCTLYARAHGHLVYGSGTVDKVDRPAGCYSFSYTSSARTKIGVVYNINTETVRECSSTYTCIYARFGAKLSDYTVVSSGQVPYDRIIKDKDDCTDHYYGLIGATSKVTGRNHLSPPGCYVSTSGQVVYNYNLVTPQECSASKTCVIGPEVNEFESIGFYGQQYLHRPPSSADVVRARSLYNSANSYCCSLKSTDQQYMDSVWDSHVGVTGESQLLSIWSSNRCTFTEDCSNEVCCEMKRRHGELTSADPPHLWKVWDAAGCPATHSACPQTELISAGGNYPIPQTSEIRAFNEIEVQLPEHSSALRKGVGVSLMQMWDLSGGKYENVLHKADSHIDISVTNTLNQQWYSGIVELQSGTCSSIMSWDECYQYALTQNKNAYKHLCSGTCPKGCYFTVGRYWWNDGTDAKTSDECSESKPCVCQESGTLVSVNSDDTLKKQRGIGNMFDGKLGTSFQNRYIDSGSIEIKKLTGVWDYNSLNSIVFIARGDDFHATSSGRSYLLNLADSKVILKYDGKVVNEFTIELDGSVEHPVNVVKLGGYTDSQFPGDGDYLNDTLTQYSAGWYQVDANNNPVGTGADTYLDQEFGLRPGGNNDVVTAWALTGISELSSGIDTAYANPSVLQAAPFEASLAAVPDYGDFKLLEGVGIDLINGDTGTVVRSFVLGGNSPVQAHKLGGYSPISGASGVYMSDAQSDDMHLWELAGGGALNSQGFNTRPPAEDDVVTLSSRSRHHSGGIDFPINYVTSVHECVEVTSSLIDGYVTDGEWTGCSSSLKSDEDHVVKLSFDPNAVIFSVANVSLTVASSNCGNSDIEFILKLVETSSNYEICTVVDTSSSGSLGVVVEQVSVTTTVEQPGDTVVFDAKELFYTAVGRNMHGVLSFEIHSNATCTDLSFVATNAGDSDHPKLIIDSCSPGSALEGVVGSTVNSVSSPSFSSDSAPFCPPNQGTPVGQFDLSQCQACDTGKYSFESTVCAECEDGTLVKNDLGFDKCTPCSEGTYFELNSFTGQAQCSNCSPGKTSDEKSIGSASCYQCAAGKFSTGGSTCDNCAVNTFSSAGAAGCTNCPAGKGSAPGSSSCSCPVCVPGQYIPFGSNLFSCGTCANCTAGKISTTYNSISCTSCSPGKYAPEGHGGECINCPVNTFSNTFAAGQCTSCALGEVALEGSRRCTRCRDIPNLNAFSIDSVIVDRCISCEPGQFLQSDNTCQNCTSGKFSTDRRAVECTLCEKGKFQSQEGRASCDACPTGKFSNTRGLDECLSCPEGRANNQIEQQECRRCGLGEYTDTVGQQTCTMCAIGKYGPVFGATSCIACEEGKIAGIQGVSQCVTCGEGEKASGLENYECTKCSAGTSNDLVGSGSCSSCTPGKFSSNEGERECTSCAPYKTQPDSGQTECLVCDDGKYAPDAVTACTACPSVFAFDLVIPDKCPEVERPVHHRVSDVLLFYREGVGISVSTNTSSYSTGGRRSETPSPFSMEEDGNQEIFIQILKSFLSTSSVTDEYIIDILSSTDGFVIIDSKEYPVTSVRFGISVESLNPVVIENAANHINTVLGNVVAVQNAFMSAGGFPSGVGVIASGVPYKHLSSTTPVMKIYDVKNVSITEVEDPNVKIPLIQACPVSQPGFTMLTSRFEETLQFITSVGFHGRAPAFVDTQDGLFSSIVDFSIAQDMSRWKRMLDMSNLGNFVDCKSLNYTGGSFPTMREAFNNVSTISSAKLIRISTNGNLHTGSVCTVQSTRCPFIQPCEGGIDGEFVETSNRESDRVYIYSLLPPDEIRNAYEMISMEDSTFSRGAMVDPFEPLENFDGVLRAKRKANSKFHADVKMPPSMRSLRVYQSDVAMASSIVSKYSDSVNYTNVDITSGIDPIKVSVISLGYSVPFVAEKSGDTYQATFSDKFSKSRVLSVAVHHNRTGNITYAGVSGTAPDSSTSLPLTLVMTTVENDEVIVPENISSDLSGDVLFSTGETALSPITGQEVTNGGVTTQLMRAYTKTGFPWGGCYKLNADGTADPAPSVQGTGFNQDTGIVECESMEYYFSVVVTQDATTVRLEQLHSAYRYYRQPASGGRRLLSGYPGEGLMGVEDPAFWGANDDYIASDGQSQTSAFRHHQESSSGYIVFEDNGAGGLSLKTSVYNYATIPVATAPIQGDLHSSVLVIDNTLLKRGRLGDAYPVEAKCPSSNDMFQSCTQIGDTSECTGEKRCGVIPYDITYRGLASMIWGTEQASTASMSPKTYMGYPGVREIEKVPAEWPVYENEVGSGELYSFSTSYGVSESLAIDMSSLIPHSKGHTLNDFVKKQIEPVCSPVVGTFARLNAEIEEADSSVMTTSISVNLSPLPFIHSLVVQSPQNMLTTGNLVTYNNVQLVKGVDWFGDKTFRLNINTKQVFGNMPPHIPVLHNVAMKATGINEEGQSIECEFSAFYPGNPNRVDLSDMVLSSTDIKNSILSVRARDIQGIILPHGKTFVRKQGENPPYWVSSTSVNMILRTQACENITEFSDAASTITHSMHSANTNLFNVYKGSVDETKIVYVSDIESDYVPQIALAKIDISSSNVVDVTQTSQNMDSTMTSKLHSDIPVGPTKFSLIPSDERGDIQKYVVSSTVTFGGEVDFTDELKQAFKDTQAAVQGCSPEDIVITKITVRGASGGLETVVDFSAIFDTLTAASSSATAQGRFTDILTAFSGATEFSGLTVSVPQQAVPVTDQRGDYSNGQVDTFPMFGAYVDTKSFVHGFNLKSCTDNVASLDELSQFKYKLAKAEGVNYVNQVMDPDYSTEWKLDYDFDRHPSSQNVAMSQECLQPRIIRDVYGKSGVSGTFLVTTTEAHLFAPIFSTWTPIVEVGNVVACLVPRVKADGFRVETSTASTLEQVAIEKTCTEYKNICAEGEITVHLHRGTYKASNFVKESLCYDTDPDTTNIPNTYTVESSGESCYMNSTIDADKDVTSDITPTCGDSSIPCTGSDSQVVDHHSCASTNISAFDYKYGLDRKHFRVDVDTVQSFSGNKVLLSTVTLDLGMFSRMASSVKIKQLILLGMEDSSGNSRRTQKLESITSTGTSMSEFASAVPTCSQSDIEGITVQNPEDPLQLSCPDKSCSGFLEIQPSSINNNFRMTTKCTRLTTESSKSDADKKTNVLLITGIIVASTIALTIVTCALMVMYRRMKVAQITEKKTRVTGSAIDHTDIKL